MARDTSWQEAYDDDNAARDDRMYKAGVWQRKLDEAKRERDMLQREADDAARRLSLPELIADPDASARWEKYRQRCLDKVNNPKANWRRDYDEARRVLRNTFGIEAE